MTSLHLENYEASVEDTEIVRGIDLDLKPGTVTAIMGPNGSGKSTLAKSLMGHPAYEVTGTAEMNGEDIVELEADERSQEGLFLSFQYPVEIPGVTVSNFIRTALNQRRPEDDPIKVPTYVKKLNETMKLLNIPKEFAQRYLNEGFSGGERKKMEILQMAMLEPRVGLLDETDSGLDVDALKEVANAINTVKEQNPEMTLLIITHYERILNYVEPDTVCIMKKGRIVEKGGKEVVDTLENKGYDAFNEPKEEQ